MPTLSDNVLALAPAGTTGTGRKVGSGLAEAERVAVEIVLEVVGATPAFTFTVQALKPGGSPSDANDWSDVAVGVANSLTASTAAPTVAMAVGRYIFFVDGMAARFADSMAVNVATNTNVTYRINLYRINGYPIN